MWRGVGLGLIVWLVLSAGGALGADDGVEATSRPTTAPAASQPAPSLRGAGELWLEGYYPRARAQYELLADTAETAVEATSARAAVVMPIRPLWSVPKTPSAEALDAVTVKVSES